MPKKLEEIREAIKSSNPGMTESQSWAIATSTYNRWKRKNKDKHKNASMNQALRVVDEITDAVMVARTQLKNKQQEENTEFQSARDNPDSNSNIKRSTNASVHANTRRTFTGRPV